MKSKTIFVYAFLLAATTGLVLAEDEGRDKTSVSPDKKWEHRVVADIGAIYKAGSDKPVLSFSEEGDTFAHEGAVVWSPDSRRFAYNCRLGGRYNSTALYQLRNGKWVKLRSPENEETTRPLDRAKAKQIQDLKLPADVYQRRIWDTWRVRNWLDANTAILYVQSTRMVPLSKEEDADTADIEADFLFTLRFDGSGKWKITRTHEMTDEEVKKENEASD